MTYIPTAFPIASQTLYNKNHFVLFQLREGFPKDVTEGLFGCYLQDFLSDSSTVAMPGKLSRRLDVYLVESPFSAAQQNEQHSILTFWVVISILFLKEFPSIV